MFTNGSVCPSPLSKGKFLQLPPSHHPQIHCVGCVKSQCRIPGLCRDFCLPSVSGLCVGICSWHCCHSRQGFVGTRGTISNTTGGCQWARRDSTDHSPALYWKKVQWKFIFAPFLTAEWAAAALPRGPCSPGMRWHQDGSGMAEPDPCPPTPVPSPARHQGTL